MDYEGKDDARSEYERQILRGADDTDFNESVADVIESGDFDTEVLERTIEIVRNLDVGDLGLVRSLKELQEAKVD